MSTGRKLILATLVSAGLCAVIASVSTQPVQTVIVWAIAYVFGVIVWSLGRRHEALSQYRTRHDPDIKGDER